MLGADFAAEFVATAHGAAREELIYDAAIRRGAVLPWKLVRVDVPTSAGHLVSFWAAEDYLAIGEPSDYVRVPCAPWTAQRIADELGMCLPTPRMTDLVWAAAAHKLAPITLADIGGKVSTPDQHSASFYVTHSRAVDQQLPPKASGLVAGCKKDVVVTNRLLEAPRRVAIYGWHRPKPSSDCSKFPATPSIAGICPIQGNSIVHEETYADYSHGVRLVWQTCMVDGEQLPIADVLKSPALASALSHEGPMALLRYAPPKVAGGSGGKAPAGPCSGLLAGGTCPGGPGGVATAAPRAALVAFGLSALVGVGLYGWHSGWIGRAA